MAKKKSATKKKSSSNHLMQLYLLSKYKPVYRKKALEQASVGLVRAICKCVKKVVKGDFQLPLKEHKQFVKHNKKLRKLIDSKTTLASKKALVQKGGLAWLIPLVAPLVTSLVGGLFGR